MSEAALYFSLSTVSQTLSGAIALLAAFVLYRLTSLNEEMGWNGAVLANTLGTDEARRLNREGRYRTLLDRARPIATECAAEFDRLKLLVRFRQGVLRWFFFCL